MVSSMVEALVERRLQMINQSDPAPIDKLFRSLGSFEFKQGDEGSVTISTEGTQGKYVIVDAVQFIPSQQE